nr:MAG TPA_asm: hypothetical protein [Caudoviricetes sp.]
MAAPCPHAGAHRWGGTGPRRGVRARHRARLPDPARVMGCASRIPGPRRVQRGDR